MFVLDRSSMALSMFQSMPLTFVPNVIMRIKPRVCFELAYTTYFTVIMISRIRLDTRSSILYDRLSKLRQRNSFVIKTFARSLNCRLTRLFFNHSKYLGRDAVSKREIHLPRSHIHRLLILYLFLVADIEMQLI